MRNVADEEGVCQRGEEVAGAHANAADQHGLLLADAIDKQTAEDPAPKPAKQRACSQSQRKTSVICQSHTAIRWLARASAGRAGIYYDQYNGIDNCECCSRTDSIAV